MEGRRLRLVVTRIAFARLASEGACAALVIVVAMAIGACGFSAALPGGAAAVDAAGESDATQAGEDAAVGVVACQTPDDSGLVVCLELEDDLADGVLDDSSPAGRHATTTGMTRVPREGASSMAVRVGPQATTYVPQSAALDLASGYTLVAWVRPDTLTPAGTARGVLDHEGQYAMITSTTAAGAIHNRCQHAGVSRYEYTERLPVGQWSFLACTWNGAQLCASRWTSATDHERYCHTPAIGPNMNGSEGLAIGHLSSGGAPHGRFDGAIDSVQVYGRGLSADQLCAMVGQPAGCLPCDLCQ